MIPLFLGAIMGIVGWAIGRGTKTTKVGAESSATGLVWIPSDPMTGVPGHWARPQVQSTNGNRPALNILQDLLLRGMPVSPGLAQAAYQEAMRYGDIVTAQQIGLVFFGPPPPGQLTAPPPPIIVGEEDNEALQATYGDAEPLKATTTAVHHNPPGMKSPVIQDISPDEWREFLLCFKTKEPGYRGERHFGAFEHATRRVSQLGMDPSTLTSEEAQYQALDKDLTNYLQSSERLLNDFTGESVNVNGEKVSVTRSGIIALLKAAGPAGAKGWLTEEHQRKAFPHTTEIFARGNGRF